jgi:hypothetical protein
MAKMYLAKVDSTLTRVIMEVTLMVVTHGKLLSLNDLVAVSTVCGKR